MKTQTYSYESLVNSKRFTDRYWAARAALEKGKYYTIDEAERIVQTYLKRKVN